MKLDTGTPLQRTCWGAVATPRTVTFLSCRPAPSLLTCTSWFTMVFWPKQRDRTRGVSRWPGAGSPSRAGPLDSRWGGQVGSTPRANPRTLAQCRGLQLRQLAYGLFSPSVCLTQGQVAIPGPQASSPHQVRIVTPRQPPALVYTALGKGGSQDSRSWPGR